MRKLSAIMFTDLVGYSALSQKNEALALELLEEHRGLLRPLFAQHNGTEIKTIGDAFLVEFTSAVEAARCAINIQKALTAHTSVVAPERRIQVRIGLHVGDIVLEEGDVLGDGVNIASRIEPLAQPGGICLTEAVAEQVRNKIACRLDKLGERKLKNIKEPVTVYSIILPWEEGKAPLKLVLRKPRNVRWLGAGAVVLLLVVVSWWWSSRQPSAVEPGQITSIAVLPLDNQMGNPDEDYFVDGMHEAIISNLARLSALKVISRTSAMHYKDTDKLMPEIARELNVDALVEGSVLKAGDRVRITAQLIHGASDEHLWANDYEGDLTDILSLQKTVARAIAREIGLALKPEEEAYLASAPQVNPEAYNLYLKGWHFRNLESGESIPKAVEYLEQAVALDPTFARAWAALAHSYFMMQWEGVGWNRDYSFNLMKSALDKALELDPNLPDAHAGLGLYQELAQYDIAGAETAFRRALELDPDNVYARYENGWFLFRTGRPDEALAELQRVQELDPLNPLPLQGIASVYQYTRQYDKTVEYWQAVLELNPSQTEALYGVASIKLAILMQRGRYAEVAAEAEKAYVEATNLWEKVQYFWLQLRAEGALGNREKVYAVRDSLRSIGELQQREQEYPFWSAHFYAIIGERDKTLSLLERADEDTTKDFYYHWGWSSIELVYYQEFDFLRAEPRFKALMQKMGLREVFDQYGQRIR